MKFDKILFGLAAVCATGLATEAAAAGQVSLGVAATATIAAPVVLTMNSPMAFGQIARPSTGTNTVVLDANNGVTLTGGGDAALITSTRTSARFLITAPAGTTYTTTQSLTLGALTNPSAATPVATTGAYQTVPAAGTQELRIGGQFDISSSTTAQTYSGTVTLQVNYN